MDLDLDGATWAVSNDAVRITANGASGRPVFVGIGRTSDVQDYLHDVDHAGIRDISTDPFRADYVQHAGSRPVTLRSQIARTSGPRRPGEPGGRR